MTHVEKLEQWCKDNNVVDLKFFPNYFFGVKLFDGPDPSTEQLAETALKLLSGEIPTRKLEPHEIEGFPEDVSDLNL